MKKKKYLGIALVVIGISIIAIALGLKYTSMSTERKLREQYEETLKGLETGETSQNNEKEKSPDNAIDKEDVDAIGIMVIPKINVKVLVVEGTGDEVLKYYVGHFKDTALPGEEGNFAVAGHRNYIYNEMFRDIGQLEENDDIIVRTKKGEYTYKVKEQKVIEPTDVEVLNKTKNATITLITCTPGGKKRLIVTGELSKK